MHNGRICFVSTESPAFSCIPYYFDVYYHPEALRISGILQHRNDRGWF